MISAIIIDDEAHCITTLSYDLDMFCPQVSIVATCKSAREGIAAIRIHKPELVFLDIEMPVMTGFEMLKVLGDPREFQVIFTTAYNEFILKAMRANAMDYLMKPVDGTELAEAVERAEKHLLNKHNQNLKIGNLLSNGTQPEEQQRIAIPGKNGYDFVSIPEICYCKAEGAYTCIYFIDQRKVLISKALGEIETMLPSRTFERIHHSVIVNVSQIRQFKKSDGLSVAMSNGDTLSVARSKKDQLLLRLGIK